MGIDINKSDFLTGYNFARLANIVFDETVTIDQFNKLRSENLLIKNKNKSYISYKVKNIRINDGSIIYASPASLDHLFFYLNKLRDVKSVTLVTSQTDRSIDKSVYEKKPKCVKKWFATNVNFEAEDLVPLPLGLANNYSSKNLLPKDFLSTRENSQKEDKLYINFQVNTNINERKNILESFVNYDWVVNKEPNLKLQEYKNDLINYKFVLCPWGNGYDTHRLWETLYAGSIPVTKYHTTYKCLENLPVIFVKDFSDISYDYLMDSLKKLNNLNYEKLNINYWKNQFFESSVSNGEYEEIKNNFYLDTSFFYKRKIETYFYKKIKRINYYLRKIFKKLNN